MAFFPHAGFENKERIAGVCLGFVCVASVSLIARTAGDTLFLSRYGRDYLPYMYMGTAVFLGLLSYAYGLAVRKFRLDTIIRSICSLLAILFLSLWLLLKTPWDGFRVFAYFMADIAVYGSMLLFWSRFGQIFDSREAKRLIGIVQASGTVGCIVSGFMVRPVSLRIGDDGLLLIVSLLLLGFAASVVLAANGNAPHERVKEESKKSSAVVSGTASFRHLLSSSQVRAMVLLMAAGTVTVTLVDYMFKSAARVHYQNQELAAFFGEFYGTANFPVLLIQILLVHRLFRRFNLGVILSILPAALLAGSAGTAFAVAFAWVVGMRFTVQAASFTIDSAGMQMLFLSIRKQSRNQARALVDGICKPAAIGATGFLLAGLSAKISLYSWTYAVAVLAAIWLFLAHRNFRAYLKSLVESLGLKKLDLESGDSFLYDRSVAKCTKDRLLSAKPEDIPYLLSIAEMLGPGGFRREVFKMLQSSNSEAKVAALSYLERHGTSQDFEAVAGCAAAHEPGLRRAALGAIEKAGGTRAVDVFSGLLGDPDAGVRAEAAARMLRLNPEDGARAIQCIEELRRSRDAKERQAAARQMDKLPGNRWADLYSALLQDADPEVREAALSSLRKGAGPEWIPLVFKQLHDINSRSAAADVLVASRQLTLLFLNSYSNVQELRDLTARGPLAGVLVRIGTAEALGFFLKLFPATEDLHSAPLIEAFCRLIGRQPSLEPYEDAVSTLISRVIRDAQESLQSLSSLTALAGCDFLRQVLEEEYQWCIRSLFMLLNLLFPDLGLQNVHLKLQADRGEGRTAALDLLENVLPGYLKQPVLELLERQRAAGSGGGTTEVLRVLESERDEWLLAGAAYAAGTNSILDAEPRVRRLKEHENAHVSEAAGWSLARLAGGSKERMVP